MNLSWSRSQPQTACCLHPAIGRQSQNPVVQTPHCTLWALPLYLARFQSWLVLSSTFVSYWVPVLTCLDVPACLTNLCTKQWWIHLHVLPGPCTEQYWHLPHKSLCEQWWGHLYVLLRPSPVQYWDIPPCLTTILFWMVLNSTSRYYLVSALNSVWIHFCVLLSPCHDEWGPRPVSILVCFFFFFCGSGVWT
jgi:hypothetical protein